jgi:DDB1- and CUL4-associated factor 13
MINLNKPPRNPSLPPVDLPPLRFRPPPGPVATNTIRTGPKRVYLDIQSRPPNVAYPPRPVPGSVADLDVIMEHCDFSQRKVFSHTCLSITL